METKRKLFCEYNRFFYLISYYKENLKKTIKDLRCHIKFADTICDKKLDFIWKSHVSIIMRKLHGVDMQLQQNKRTNLEIACKKMNGLIIRPGETFSYWKLVGKTTKKRGYKVGLVISKNQISQGYGGGLCQLANLIHYIVLHTPLEITEMHHHSDALFPDSGRRVPFGTGTSVSYKSLDYRFKNNTDHDVQLLVWTDDENLYGEIRSDIKLDKRYRLSEEGHCYTLENGVYFRNSKVYRITENTTDLTKTKELILDNHSRVLYDYSLIPENEIKGK